MASVDYVVWPELNCRKVFREAGPPSRPAATLSLAAARNEHEGGQVVVSAGDRPLRRVEVSCSLLRGPGGAEIAASLYRVAYILLPAKGKRHPDPLPPLAPFDVAAGESQPVWLTACVPADAPAGTYRGEVRVAPSNAAPTTLRVSLRVWDFTLPATPSTRTAFGINYAHIARQHGVTPETDAGRRLKQAYYEMLLAHRISPYHPPVDLTSPEAARYLDDPRMTSYVIPYSDDAAKMRALVEHLRQGGWLSKGFFYPSDEPVNKEQYDRIVAQAKAVHAISRSLKVVSPFFRDPDFSEESVYDLLDGTLDIWCAVSAFYDQTQPRMRAKQRKGQEGWWYVCCGPGKPYANFFVDYRAVEHRILLWQQRKYAIQGLLYWSTTYWNPEFTEDPWQDIATVKHINEKLYGDGSLLYPGKQVGVEGPVSSIRLEAIRDGLEDYEYLVLLEQAKGKRAAQAAIARVVTDMKVFSRSAPLLTRVRREIAEEIEAR